MNKKRPTDTPLPPPSAAAEEQFALKWLKVRRELFDTDPRCPPEALGAFEVIARMFYFQGRTDEVVKLAEFMRLTQSVAGRAS